MLSLVKIKIDSNFPVNVHTINKTAGSAGVFTWSNLHELIGCVTSMRITI